jgi:hypothetical protein
LLRGARTAQKLVTTLDVSVNTINRTLAGMPGEIVTVGKGRHEEQRRPLRTENWGRNSRSLRDGEVKGSPCDPLDTGRRIADISDEEAEAAAVAAIRPRSRRRRTAPCR